MDNEIIQEFLGFPIHSDSKESVYNTGDLSSIPWLGRSPGEGNRYPLQYSCQENPMDREAWWATVHRATELDMTERLTLLDKKGKQLHPFISSIKKNILSV